MSDPRTILVTGSNRGIGQEVVRQLVQRGHRVVLTSRVAEEGGLSAAAINREGFKGEAFHHPLDVTDQESIQILKVYLLDQLSGLDVLINNAAIHYDRWHPAHDADLKEVHETLKTNLFGPWYMIQALLPLLKASKHPRIFNVSSQAGQLKSMKGGTPGYGVSKAALNVLTLKLADELRADGVLVNSMCPGWVKTDMGGEEAPRSKAQGADTMVWLAEMEDGGPSGKFFYDRKEIDWYPCATIPVT